MKAKKIIKVIAKLAAVSGVAFVAYKLGECNGESKERIRQKYDDENDEDYNFIMRDNFCNLDDYDEPDCGCIKPSCDRGDKS